MPVNPFLAASNPFLVDEEEERKRRLRAAQEAAADDPKPLTLIDALKKRGELAAKGFAGGLYGAAERIGNMPRALAYPLGLGNAREALGFIEPGTKVAMDEREAELKRQLVESDVAQGRGGLSSFISSEGPGIVGGALQNILVPMSKPMQALGKAATPLKTALKAGGLSAAEGLAQGWAESAGRSVGDQAKAMSLSALLSGAAGAAPGLGEASRSTPPRTLTEALSPEPRVVTRFDTEAGAANLTGKPQGTYTALGDSDVYSQHGFGDVRTTGEVRPKNPLVIQGNDDFSAGQAMIRHLLGPDELDRMRALPKEELAAEIQARYPGADTSQAEQAIGTSALLDIAGAQEAKVRGYDFAEVHNKHDPRYSEGVVLDDSIANWKRANPLAPPDPATAVRKTIEAGIFDADKLEEAALVDLPPVEQAKVRGMLKEGFDFFAGTYGEHADDAAKLVEELKVNEQANLRARGVGVQVPVAAQAAEQEAVGLATTLGVSVDDIMKPRKGYTPDTQGLRLLHSESKRLIAEVKEGSDRLAAGLKDGSLSPADADALRTKIAADQLRSAEVMTAVLGHRSEAGRALGSLKFAVRRAFAAPEQQRMVLLQRYKNQLTDDAIQKIAKLDPNRPQDLVAFARTMEHPSIGSMFDTAWIASVLSGVGTQSKNLFGNATQLATEVPVRAVGSLLDSLRGKQGRAMRFADQGAAAAGAWQGTKAGLAKAAFILKNGFDKDQAVSKFATSQDHNLFRNPFLVHPNATVRGVGTALTVPLRALESADAFFRTVGKTSKQYEMANLKASKTGKAMADHLLDEDVLQAADDFGKRMTYTDETSWVGQGMSYMGKLADQKGGPVTGRLFKMAFPFVAIPDRIIARGFEHSPVGLVRTVGQSVMDLAREGKIRPEAAESAARGMIGTAVIGYGMKLYAEGRITGPPPKDPNERAEFFRTKKAFSYLPATGRPDHPEDWIPYSQMGPLGTAMGAAATAAQLHTNAKDSGGNLNLLADALRGTARFTLEQAYMDSLQSIVEAIEDEKTGGQVLARAAGAALGGVVPYSALQRNVAQAIDPTVRNVSPEGEDPSGLQTIANSIQANTPGLSQNLPARITPYGDPIVRQETALGPFVGRDTPMAALAAKPRQEDPVADALASVGKPMEFASKVIDVNHEKLRIPPRDYERIQKRAGDFVRAEVQKALDSGRWSSYMDEQKALFADKVQQEARKRARLLYEAEIMKTSGLTGG